VYATASAIDDWGEDNWGAPTYPVEHWSGRTLEQLSKECDWEWGKFSELFEGATLQWYSNTQDWQTFKGYDLVPERHGIGSAKFRSLDAKTFGSNIKGGRCKITDDGDSEWVLERIGPFKSTGDYDWWQFAWDDTFQTRKILKEYPDGYFILNHFSGAVDANGVVLPFPPIHVHHVHCSPGTVNPYRAVMAKCFMGEESECHQAYRTIFEQHGDYQCTEEDGGTRCLLEDMPHGYGKLVTTDVTINGELNDVRPKGSPELEWYYQAAIRWVPKVKAKDLTPLSMHYFWSPGRLDLFDQSTMVVTFKAPTAYDSMIWYTGTMHYSGTLIRGKMHTHNTIFKESLFFAGTPEEIGMLGSRFQPKGKVFDPIPLKDMKFESIDAAQTYILDAYHQHRSENPNSGVRLICKGDTNNEDIVFPSGTYKFDRRAPTWCGNWEFKKGDAFTAVGFNRHAGGPPGPHMPDRIPEWLPGHLHWFMFSDTHDDSSHYEYGFYTQNPEQNFVGASDSNMAFGSRLNMITMVLNAGMPSQNEFYAILFGVMMVVTFVVSSFGFCTYKVVKLVKSD
jgi:hypothetical protein